MKNLNKNINIRKKSLPRQSDLTIRPDGTVYISYIWKDLADLAGIDSSEVNPSPNNHININFELDDTNTKHLYNSCSLCPKDCGFDRWEGIHPKCGNHQLCLSAAGISMGEEKLITGNGGTGMFIFSGCPLSCPSCHGESMIRGHYPESNFQDVFKAIDNIYNAGAQNIQFICPPGHYPKISLIVAQLKKMNFPIPIILKSSGYEKVETIKQLNGLIDIYLPDCKILKNSQHALVKEIPDYFDYFEKALTEMYRQVGPVIIDAKGNLTKGVLVRHVRGSLSIEEFSQMEKYLNSLTPNIAISILDNFISF